MGALATQLETLFAGPSYPATHAAAATNWENAFKYLREVNGDFQVGGKLGIGVAPTYPVHVLTGDGEGFVQTNGTVTVATYVDTIGYVGTRSNHALGLYVNNGAPKLRIGTDGRIGIGTNVTAVYCLDVVEDRVSSWAARIFNDGNAANREVLLLQGGADVPASNGDVVWLRLRDGDGSNVAQLQYSTVSPNAALVAASDESLKENVRPTQVSALGLVRGFRLFEYDWRADENGKRRAPRQKIGWIAQQCADVYPEMVHPIGDGLLGVADACLIPVLVKAVQELDAEINTLRGRP